MRRCLVRYANDLIRSSGLIAETVVTLSKLLFTASKKTNIAPSVLINVCVQRQTVRPAWRSHALLMNA
jgi:hypothetical protein